VSALAGDGLTVDDIPVRPRGYVLILPRALCEAEGVTLGDAVLGAAVLFSESVALDVPALPFDWLVVSP
jgi:hypothetical protein